MARTTPVKVPKKPEKKTRKVTPKNNNFFTILLHGIAIFFRAVDVFLHKRRTLGSMGEYFWTHGVIGFIRRQFRIIGIFLRKKRTLKGTWGQICDFFKETPEEEVREAKTWLGRNQYVIWDSIMLLLVYAFLFSGLKMEWFLRDIIPIGGDVPYHYANYIDFKEILIPHFQISGWTDASFGGFQLFQGYPVFPFILIYLLDIFIGSGVAFKTVLILGAVGLPLATYWTLFQSRVARPGPIFGAILSLAYLFHDDHFAFGGNLRSVFSGEFAHSLSILLLVIFCGFLYKAFESKKYIPHAVITLALVGFSHPVSFAVAIFLPLGFLISIPADPDDSEKKSPVETLGFWQKSSVAFRVTLMGGLLFCTWAIGYYMNSKFRDMNNPDIVSDSFGWGITFNYLIPRLLLPFAVLFCIYVIYYIFRWKKTSSLQAFFLWGTLISIGFFLFKFMGFAIRFLPLIYLFVMLFLASTIGKIYQETKKESVRIFVCCLIIASATFIFYFVDSGNIFQRYRGTSGHNFIGAESREEWKSVQLTSEFLSNNFDTQTDSKKTFPPRVFSYFKGDLFRVTSRASLYDSLFSYSFFTSQGIWTGRQIDKKQISVEKFWNFMDLSNTKIIIVTKELAEYIGNSSYFSLLKTFDQYKVFETNNTSSDYVVPLKNKVYAITDLRTWKKVSEKWYGEYSEKSPFIVYNPDKKQSAFIPYNAKKVVAIPYRDTCKVQEFVQREKITIHTNCIGRPLLVKFAYHQNWKVTGADQIYLTTPAFMMVIPKQADVVLYYGKRPYNYVAYACGILGILLLFSHTYIERKLVDFYRKLSEKYTLFQNSRLRKIGVYLLNRSVPILVVLILLVSIAFVYTNKG